MKFQSRLLCSLALVLSALLPGLASADSKFIYVTRHAEKADATNPDSVLSAAGQVRAQNIAATLKKAGITSIYTTSYQRTRQTAAPLGAILNVIPTTYDDSTPAAMATFIQSIRALPGNTLVVGHSDTVPELVRLLSGDTVPAIAETEFDRLYQIAIAPDTDATTTLLNSLPSGGAVVVPCPAVSLPPQTGLSGLVGSWTFFTINVPECATKLTVTTSSAANLGDADLFIRAGAKPTASASDCKSATGTNVETCEKPTGPAAVWHIGIYGFKAFSGLTLNAVAVP